MPPRAMPKAEFNSYVESRINAWTQTHSQIARQLAFYYEENGICYPRFTRETNLLELYEYMINWATKYFIPNPYTPSLRGYTPTCLYSFITKSINEGKTDFDEILDSIFHVKLSSHDKVNVYLSNFTNLLIDNRHQVSINDKIDYLEAELYPEEKFAIDTKLYFEYFTVIKNKTQNHNTNLLNHPNQQIYRPYITAIKSKPFLLLAGISGTGKSRIVRELARACWEEGTEEYKAQKPKNFAMIQVKPNWHDSSELIGYVSRVSGEPVFVAGDFLKFVAKAWENEDVPHFLCLDEMNLAPVEQYFAEYLSVIESRKNKDGKVVTDAIVEKCSEQWYFDLTAKLTEDEEVRTRFLTDGITIPQNLIVVGTVNMDETTFSFSRKVLDRAMTIEMNEVDLASGLGHRHEQIGLLGETELIGTAVEGVDVYNAHKEVCDKVIGYLKAINLRLENTPFKIAYRTRNEALLYVVNNLPYNKNEAGEEIPQEVVIVRALDEITNMKILSRIEGDESKINNLLDDLKNIVKEQLNLISGKEYSSKKMEGDEASEHSISLAKLEEMKGRLRQGYTSFWS
ncbi:MAG: AAA family ATPase [Bacteroidaceae bacterium]|nr:AAA family ATPase [Bacteroidaceae bacterium]